MAVRCFVDGKWLELNALKSVYNPYSNKKIDDVCLATSEIIEKAVIASEKGFRVYNDFKTYERVNILEKIYKGLEQQKGDFIKTIIEESGKPVREAVVEVERAIITFKLAAAEAERIPGELIHLDIHKRAGDRVGLVKLFPVGPILAITPFNFPLNLVAHKLAPALAAGCSIILKPSSKTPLTSLKLGRVIQEAGIPDGLVSVIPCSVENAELMVQDDRLKMVTFTGSAKVGWKLKKICGKKKIMLELGGNAAAIVDSDADIDYCTDRCVKGGYAYAGQVCISLQRIFVHETIYHQFKQRYIQKVRSLKLGNPMDDDVQMGPMINEREASRVLSWIHQAIELGSDLLVGGEKKGNFIVPAVLEHVPRSALVNKEEVFGPVTILYSYASLEEAIHAANDSRFGLQLGVFSNNWSAIWQVFRKSEVGGVIVNDVPTIRVDNYPYGGIKDSGIGREGVKYAIEEMMMRKILVLPV